MGQKHRFEHKKFRVAEGDKVRLSKISTAAGKELEGKKDGAQALVDDLTTLTECQGRLYAEGRRSLLVILQGMDAAGKDGTIRHVMQGVNPQGCRIHGFRAPNTEELQHHFLWRPMRFLPERGMISIFNRSYYEEVLVVRVHPEFLEPQKLPPFKKLSNLWSQRFDEIRNFEKALINQGTQVIKFYLHLSQDEQKKRLLERLNTPEKQWKFNSRDLDERKLWMEYEKAFEDMMENTSTKQAPWYIIPADDKWYSRAAIADIITNQLEGMNLQYPEVTAEQRAHYQELAATLGGSIASSKAETDIDVEKVNVDSEPESKKSDSKTSDANIKGNS
ncbi:MAG: polyphosphate kinase 2 family protein [Planctomycetota bacterium]|nr:polyphosphate kinase 2 family protein [Planctomycetota bacterium]